MYNGTFIHLNTSILGHVYRFIFGNQSLCVRRLERDVVYLGWPITLSYEPKCGGREGVSGSQSMSSAVHRSPNKLWRSNSIFNLCYLYNILVHLWSVWICIVYNKYEESVYTVRLYLLEEPYKIFPSSDYQYFIWISFPRYLFSKY